MSFFVVVCSMKREIGITDSGRQVVSRHTIIKHFNSLTGLYNEHLLYMRNCHWSASAMSKITRKH